MSYAKHSKEFKKLIQVLDEQSRQSSSHYRFEVMYMAIGGVINQDQNLVLLSGSDAFIDFFLDQFNCMSDLALAQGKAHVYDHLSKCMLQNEDIDMAAQPPSPSRGQATIKMSMLPPSPSSSQVAIKMEATPSDEFDLNINELKARFKALADEHNVELISSRGNFQWKKLGHLFAAAGFVLHNYPEGVPFPSDTAGSKGIAGLKHKEAAILLNSFTHPTHPLMFKRMYKNGVPVTEPAIIGIPPDYDSPFRHGHCKFVDEQMNTDQNGPSCLLLLSSATTKKPPSKKANLWSRALSTKQKTTEDATSQSRTSTKDAATTKASRSKSIAPNV
ncbi:hypothetical protein CPB84DRAFT_1842348 [Gymnopilus junonius]|uniref:Uncharacterized protein n=1 Tax=Gymnopilus junonius TaxID=109634 RepID=A0A9P5P1L6_GYMJU|nr:hypothetical protein CPB84DRAFT_1842348 [Gymnopilus junonius]